MKYCISECRNCGDAKLVPKDVCIITVNCSCDNPKINLFGLFSSGKKFKITKYRSFYNKTKK